MGDWQQLLQSVLIGLIFSYLLAKLISIVVSFKDDNLSLTRSHHDADAAAVEPQLPAASARGEADSVVAEHGSDRNDDGDGDSDDWEGVESSELDEAFSAATAFVAAAASEKAKVPAETQLQLYGLYKIATEGPCSTSQPSPLKITARSKWQAWQKLGAMPPEDAMQKYIDIVTELFPTWAAGSAVLQLDQKSRGGVDVGGGATHSVDQKGPIGPVFSSLVMEDVSADDTIMDAVHGFAREGELDNLLRCVDSGVSVNLKDSQGQTPLHWAVDRGHHDIVEVLVGKNADVNAMDNEGQTPLHYAVVCEREAIAEFLVNHSADTDVRDNEGMTARDICNFDWPCLRPVASKTR